MKVLSLSFTSNREDMFDLDSSVTRVAIVRINLIECIVGYSYDLYEACDSFTKEAVM